MSAATQMSGLTQTEMQAIFRLVIKRPSRPLPAATDNIPAAEAVLILAAGILKGYGFDSSAVLTLMARLWAWLEGGEGDEERAITLNVIDRRYVGWNCMGRSVLVDMTTGDEIMMTQPIPTVLESVAYGLYELLKRRTAIARGERASLWEDRDATRHTARSQATEGIGGLGEPEVLRDGSGSLIS